MISPAHEPNAGRPSAMSLRIGSSRSNAVASFHSVVDSPPGMTRPSADSISLQAADRPGGRAGLVERAHVLAHVALQREHSNDRQDCSFPRGNDPPGDPAFPALWLRLGHTETPPGSGDSNFITR